MNLKTLPVNLKIFVISILCIGAIGFMEKYKDQKTLDSRSPASYQNQAQ